MRAGAKPYRAKEIEVLRGLDPVRRRPGMYTDTRSPNHLICEVVDNSVDEVLAGFALRIELILHKDGSVSVSDDGRGMPVDLHPGEGLTGVELILTRLHAGAKFSNTSYRFAGGLHGVGVSVVNALSSSLEVQVRRDGAEYKATFRDGRVSSRLRRVARVGKRNTGTRICFLPNARYFDSPQIQIPPLLHVLRAKAVLCPGLHVQLQEEGGKQWQWCYPDGMRSYLAASMPECELLPATALTGRLENENGEAEWMLQWLAEPGAQVTESYVNLIPTTQGGSHVNGLRQGIAAAFRSFCERRGLLPHGVRLGAEDTWWNCAYLLSLKLPNPQFTGQTKERLASVSCTPWVAEAVQSQLLSWLHQHVQSGESLANLAISHAQARQRAARQVQRSRLPGTLALPGKLADCSSRKLEHTELFLVEGDSAGGSARQARDRAFQAILPLRGKILNAWEVGPATLAASREVRDIATAIGIVPGSADLEGLRYGKICILADADSDGAHIATLLCALLLRHFQPLVQQGYVYVAMPPLYRIDAGKQVFYARDATERDQLLGRLESRPGNVKLSLQRFKGLGEMSAAQLRETTLAPATRHLVQLTLGCPAQAEQMLDMLLAKKRAADRRSWLQTRGKLARADAADQASSARPGH